MNKGIIIGILALVLVGGGLFIFSNRNTSDKAMMEKDAMMMEKTDESTMEKKDDPMMTKEGAMMSKGSYENYSPEKLTLASTGDVLLFFHATWCPICRSMESEINADMSKIPDGVHILKVDYDTATALRQKYGVTVQHTFVQVDSSGNSLQKFSDAPNLSDVLSRIK